MAQWSEQGAMTAMSAGDDWLSEEEILRLWDVGCCVLGKLVRNPHDLGDCKSKLYLKIFDNQKTIADVVPLARNRFVRTMAKNLVADHYRRPPREVPLTADEDGPDGQAYARWAEGVEGTTVGQIGPILTEYASRSPKHRQKASAWVRKALYRDELAEIADDIGQPRWKVWRWFNEVTLHIRRELERQTPPNGDVE
jgi:DNA-directed RNA polymerase specialized sigma24 family protein